MVIVYGDALAIQGAKASVVNSRRHRAAETFEGVKIW